MADINGVTVNTEELRAMSQVDLDSIDKNELLDIRNITIDKSAPVESRLQQYISGVKNPFFFRVGDTAVKLEFSNNGRTLHEALIGYLSGLKESK